MQPSQVLTMAFAAGAHLMGKAHLNSSTTTKNATGTNTSPVPTGTAHPMSDKSTVWITTTISATTQLVTATAAFNATATPSTFWVTATANATTTFVDWTMYPEVPITLTTSSSPSSPAPVSSPASVEPLEPKPSESTPAIDPEPPSLDGPWCNVEREFPKHDHQAQIKPNFIKYSAMKFCKHWEDSDMSPESEDLSADSRDENDTQYHYFLSWDKGCTHSDGSQNIGKPMGDDGPSCKKLMTDINKKCHKGNHGVGGFYKAGCLKYEFIGGKLPLWKMQ